MTQSNLKELEVQFIVFTGYYTNKDDGKQLQEHTEETLELYMKGLNTYQGELGAEDVFQGVCFDTDDSPLAEYWIDGTEEYFPIQ